MKEIVQRLANNWQYKSITQRRKIKLTEDEATLYEFLISHGHKPATVYRWILLAEAPQQIKMQLMNGELSQRDAHSAKAELKGLLNTTEDELMQDITECVRKYLTR